jgi:pyruvate dehydrogenase E1 component alpha subunit/2-oxoisovalerate dehydrogenase E1 component alpha subunit
MTYRRKGHAEHDNQSYVPPGEIERWAAENDPLDRYLEVLREEDGLTDAELADLHARIQRQIDEATDLAESSPMPDAEDALTGVYADPARMAPLWFRARGGVVREHERAQGWGTFDG